MCFLSLSISEVLCLCRFCFVMSCYLMSSHVISSLSHDISLSLTLFISSHLISSLISLHCTIACLRGCHHSTLTHSLDTHSALFHLFPGPNSCWQSFELLSSFISLPHRLVSSFFHFRYVSVTTSALMQENSLNNVSDCFSRVLIRIVHSGRMI